jgi:hypothetical protein
MSTYIKLSTGAYPLHIGDIELDPAGIEDYALVEYVDRPEYDKTRQVLDVNPPVQVGGKWQMVWSIRDGTPEELELANKPYVDPLEIYKEQMRQILESNP